MTILATAGAVEKGLSRVAIAGKQLLNRIRLWNAGRPDRFGSARMQKRGDIGYLFIRHRSYRRHAFIRAAETNDFADEVSVDVMSDERRANKIGTARPGGIGAMAESTGLLEQLASPIEGGRIFRLLLCSSFFLCVKLCPHGALGKTKGKNERKRKSRKLACTALP